MKIRLSLRARPDYVAEQGAIYLRDLELLSVKTEPADVGTALSPLLPTLQIQSLSPVPLPRPPSTGSMAAARNEARIRRRSKPSRWSRADWSSPSN